MLPPSRFARPSDRRNQRTQAGRPAIRDRQVRCDAPRAVALLVVRNVAAQLGGRRPKRVGLAVEGLSCQPRKLWPLIRLRHGRPIADEERLQFAASDTHERVRSTGRSALVDQPLLDAMAEVRVKTSVKKSVKTSGKILALICENALVTIPELAASIGVSERSIEPKKIS